jgi:hypothetical protein
MAGMTCFFRFHFSVMNGDNPGSWLLISLFIMSRIEISEPQKMYLLVLDLPDNSMTFLYW